MKSWLGQTPYEVMEIGEGDPSIDRTASIMANQIRRSIYVPAIRKWAEYIIQNVAERDKVGYIRAVYNFVKSYVRYVNDPVGMEYIQTPLDQLKQIKLKGYVYGDCDDMSVLGLSLLQSLGFEVKLKVASYREDGQFEHIYGLVHVNNQWIPFDCVKKEFTFGFEVPGAVRIKEYDV